MTKEDLPNVTTPPEMVEITDVNQFITIIQGWHTAKLEILRHIAKIPKGTELETTDDATGKVTTVTLNGDYLEGIKAGLAMAIHELKELPFAAMPEEDTTDVDQKG